MINENDYNESKKSTVRIEECQKGSCCRNQNFIISKSSLISILSFVLVLLVIIVSNTVDGQRVRRVLSEETEVVEVQESPYHRSQHKALFPLDSSDVWGFGFASFALMIAAGGGIGGGGMLVPIYILVMGFTPKYAIPLSNVTVLGGSVANTLVNWTKRHPLADRPLIDWDLILIMEPLTIAGALIGAILNKILPEQVVVFLLVLLLSFTAYTTLSKAISMYKKETKEMAKQQLSTTTNTTWAANTSQAQLSNLAKLSQLAEEQEAQEALLDHVELSQINDDQYEEELLQSITNNDKNNSSNNYKSQRELQQIIEEERGIPLSNVTVIVALFLVILIINVLKGGGAFSSPLGIVCGSTSFWVANAIMLLWILLLIFFGRAYLIHRYHLKKRCQYTYVEGDIQWNERATIVYPFICCFAGFFSGMFGIGGGIVKGKRKRNEETEDLFHICHFWIFLSLSLSLCFPGSHLCVTNYNL
jgi:uncharacterized membrane protein YfcA